MAVIFIFIDGIGIGENTDENPLADSSLKSFSWFTGSNGLHKKCEPVNKPSVLFKPVDANLDVKGLPQSGTGQVALFSGQNASKIAGRHFGPFPHSKTKHLLEEESLFHKVIELGKNPAFMNAYPDIFFERAEKRGRWSATTLMAKSAGVKLNRVEDLLEGNAVTAEIKQNVWRETLGIDVPVITEEEAAGRVIRAADKYDLVLYEYYLTDKAGHSMVRKFADDVLSVLDNFLISIIHQMKESDTLVICTDHGNIEDLSIKTHTRNPVPLFVKGDTKPFAKAESILDVTPGILEVLKN